MNQSVFGGLMVANLSPFDSEDRVNATVARDHAKWMISQGVQGLCPCGTTGEMLYLDADEKESFIAASCEASVESDGSIPVIAGVWALRQTEVRRLSQFAESAGAQGVFLPPPIYYPASDDDIFAWYSNVKSACSLPVFAYNIPSYAANGLSQACLLRLVEGDVIAGVKDSTASPERMQWMVENLGEYIAVEAASDAFVTASKSLGADGFISALANAAPMALRRLWDGDVSLESAVTRLRGAVKVAGGIPAIKWLVSRRGIGMGMSRLPTGGIHPDQSDLLISALADLDLAISQLTS